MLEIFRDAIWQSIGALLTIIVPLVVWWFNIRVKEKSLTYDVVVIVPLLTIGEEVKGKIKVLYEDQPVENLYVVILELYNNGRKSILPTDILEPIRFVFSEGSRILTTEVITSLPVELGPKIIVTIENNSFLLAPTLFNQNDKLRFKVLVENNERRPFASAIARIVDIHEITQKEYASGRKLVLSFSLLLGGMFWLLSMLRDPFVEASGWVLFFVIVVPALALIVSGGWLMKQMLRPIVEENKYIGVYLGQDTVETMRTLFR